MSKLYKLTDENNQTYNNTQWGPNISHSGTGEGELCGPGWIHAYESPYTAVFMNPIHTEFLNPNLWEAKGVIKKRDSILKVGCKKLTTIKKIKLPEISIEQRVEIAIRLAMLSNKDEAWLVWANTWLSGKDRTSEAAWTAIRHADWSASAAWATECAARADESVWAIWAVDECAKCSARTAVDYARVVSKNFDLVGIIRQVLKAKK